MGGGSGSVAASSDKSGRSANHPLSAVPDRQSGPRKRLVRCRLNFGRSRGEMGDRRKQTSIQPTFHPHLPLAAVCTIRLKGSMHDATAINEAAVRRCFKRKGKASWVRRTADFVQLVSLQGSAWSADQNYVNFGLWPLAVGEPTTLAESKMMFRTRAEDLGASDFDTLFNAADRLQSLENLRASLAGGSVSGLVSVELRRLLDI